MGAFPRSLVPAFPAVSVVSTAGQAGGRRGLRPAVSPAWSRSEERRVGEKGRTWGWPDHLKKKNLKALLLGSLTYSTLAIAFPFFPSMFLYGSWMHVTGTMWLLYIFGDNCWEYLGYFPSLVID